MYVYHTRSILLYCSVPAVERHICNQKVPKRGRKIHSVGSKARFNFENI